MMTANEKLQMLIGQQVFRILALEDELAQAQAKISELQQLVEAQPDQPAAEAPEGQGEAANA